MVQDIAEYVFGVGVSNWLVSAEWEPSETANGSVMRKNVVSSPNFSGEWMTVAEAYYSPACLADVSNENLGTQMLVGGEELGEFA